MTRYERASRGDLVSYRYEGYLGRMATGRGVVASAGGGTVELEDGTVLDIARGEVGGDELYQVMVVVPASQVRYPGVEPGDVVKVGTGSHAYRVTAVEDGMVTLADGRTLPVTQLGAFDEDVNDRDPFGFASDASDFIGGGGR